MMTPAIRIVIDRNIWISGLLWKGDSQRLLNLAEEGRVEICIAYPMLLELEEVLSYERFQPRLKQIGLTPAQLATFAFTLATPVELPERRPPIVIADPDDDIFLYCAIEAQAICLVTHDRHLLPIGEVAGIQILRVDDFLAEYFPE